MYHYLKISKYFISQKEFEVVFSELIYNKFSGSEFSEMIKSIMYKERGDWFNITNTYDENYSDTDIVLYIHSMDSNTETIVNLIKNDSKIITDYDNVNILENGNEFYPIYFLEMDCGSFQDLKQVFEENNINIAEISKNNEIYEDGAGSVFLSIIFGIISNFGYDLIRQKISILSQNKKIKSTLIISPILYKDIVKYSYKISGIEPKFHRLISMSINDNKYTYKFSAIGKRIDIFYDKETDKFDYSINV